MVMSSSGVFALFVFVAIGAVVCDDCTDASWAPTAANNLATTTGLEVGINFQNALTQLWAAASTNSKFAPTLYYGVSGSGNFYQLINCEAIGYSNSLCEGGSQYIFVARNFVAFRNKFLNAYKTDGAGNLVGTTPYAKSTTAYDPQTQPWFLSGSGWLDGSVTYYQSFAAGVAAADRLSTEPCGPCLTGSLPLAWSTYWAAHETSGAGIKTLAGVISYGQNILKAIKAMTSEIFPIVYVGFSNGDFYGISDCRDKYAGCAKEGYSLQYVNAAVVGNSSLVFIQLDTNGVVIGTPEYNDVYPTTERPWYIIQNGWTDPYADFTTKVVLRTFSMSFRYGVAAADTYVSNTGSCYIGRNGLYPTDYSGYTR